MLINLITSNLITSNLIIIIYKEEDIINIYLKESTNN